MKIIPLTKGYFTYVDDEDYDELVKYRWNAKTNKSHSIVRASWTKCGKNGERIQIYMHRLTLGLTDPKVLCDHIDLNPLNNQRKNLRVATKQQNNVNMPPFGKSKYKGVTHYGKKFKAQICTFGQRIALGIFASEIDAAVAYNEAATKYHGEFAYLNQVT